MLSHPVSGLIGNDRLELLHGQAQLPVNLEGREGLMMFTTIDIKDLRGMSIILSLSLPVSSSLLHSLACPLSPSSLSLSLSPSLSFMLSLHSLSHPATTLHYALAPSSLLHPLFLFFCLIPPSSPLETRYMLQRTDGLIDVLMTYSNFTFSTDATCSMNDLMSLTFVFLLRYTVGLVFK